MTVQVSRRALINAASTLALTAAASPLLVSGALAQSVDDDLLYPVDRPDLVEDKVLGNPDAKVTVVEYASFTCPHCASFHKNTWPALKEKYIDTNKIRFIYRDFPLDNLAAAASMLSRCAPEGTYFNAVDAFMKNQQAWISRENTVAVLLDYTKQLGFTQETFKSCLSDQELLNKVNKTKEYAGTNLDIRSTPTFFINGEQISGAIGIEEFSKKIDALL